MITDLQVQHELLKTALEATDNYLMIEKRAKAQGMATNSMIHDFTYEMARAHDALQSLGVLDKHQDYMEYHIEEMLKLHGHEDQRMAALPYAHIPQADYGEPAESVSVRKLPSFAEFIGEEKKSDEFEVPEAELDLIAAQLKWEDIEDLYDDDEFVDEDEDEDEDEEDKKQIKEGLTQQSRLKKRQSFARFRGKRNVVRGMKLRRASTIETLKKRAVLAARRSLYKRFLRGRDKSTMSAAEKDRVEQQVKKLRFMQSTLATKMLPKMREIEQKRIAHYRGKKK